MRQGFQAQAPLDGAQETAQWGETLPVPQVSQTVLPQRLLQPAHQPQVLLLQACVSQHLSQPGHFVRLSHTVHSGKPCGHPPVNKESDGGSSITGDPSLAVAGMMTTRHL